MRKAKWVLDTLKTRSKDWDDVNLGIYDMKIISLHVFSPEREVLKQNNK